ncbi:MarR family winged helix-turn-helix transcriptional regulator [Neptunomonas antarctica]|uniref:DNA-binding transcriptional regulator, MarR family n=1 Tax=Neptunomonas antarctica TaxID=619304 RepID=A0A1N7M2Z7_9GAMM|nr:MarR family winged helix-turn-helix transcriptional regulator [Neptunomonas antarctica]SIS80496.1 DNA-binding transcriptional regulator, MarR family [Neptunomonas antarctica]
MENRIQTEVRVTVLLGIVRQLMATREAKLFAGRSLNPSQFGVLNHFTHHPKRSWTVTDLAQVMEMNQPGITKIVNTLLDRGLLKAHSDTEDKRRRHLLITNQGLKLCDETLTALLPDIAHTLGSWDDSELSQLHQHMEKLMHWLDEHRDDILRT